MKVLKTMHTFNTDHAYLEAFSDYQGWTSEDERAEIWHNLDVLVTQLGDIGINYNRLRNSLCPRRNKHEVCLMFDSSVLEKEFGNYAYGASKFVVPALPKDLNTAIRHGDLISENPFGDLRYLKRTYPYLLLNGVVATNQLFCVHLSNLSVASLAMVRERLRSALGFVGIVDTTLQSPLKNLISGILPACLLKVGRTYISANYESVEVQEGFYDGTWDLHSSRMVSVNDLLFDQYLVYKVQRSSGGIFSPYEALLLTSLDSTYVRHRAAKIEIAVDEEKFAYLLSSKRQNIKNMGLVGLDAHQLSELIEERVRNHYVYGLRLLEDGVLLCSTIVEINRVNQAPYRAEIGLRLEPSENRFYITTMY